MNGNSPLLKLADHRLGASIALISQLGGFAYEGLELALHLLRLLHRRFHIAPHRGQIVPFKHELDALKRKPYEQGNNGQYQGQTRAASLSRFGCLNRFMRCFFCYRRFALHKPHFVLPACPGFGPKLMPWEASRFLS